MHRVELKAISSFSLANSCTLIMVPNAPCGVESVVGLELRLPISIVPNAPCGVESKEVRVMRYVAVEVPNAPCGVESEKLQEKLYEEVEPFLMHRVELKASSRKARTTFLM